MAQHDVVVIGGSAGALPALRQILEQLPASLPACILAVLHTAAEGDGFLPDILERASSLPVAFAKNHDPVVPGRVYIAPPDFHLIVTSSGLRVVHGPRENGFRPAIDPLFRTAARECGSRVVGVILSGGLSDGTYGLSVIKQHGGVAIVQNPEDAIVTSMPANALNAVNVDYVRDASDIAATIERLSREPDPESAPEGDGEMARSREVEPQLPVENSEVTEMATRFGPPSALTCPDCGGALWEIADDRLVRYQCHVGHQYAPDALESEQRATIDSALWSAVRVLEERADLKGRLARRAAANGLEHVSDEYAKAAREAHGQAQTIRAVLFAAANDSPAMTAAAVAAEELRPPTPSKGPDAPRGSEERQTAHRNFARARRRN
jgi:two-component system chemotaxis response regulator CheB